MNKENQSFQIDNATNDSHIISVESNKKSKVNLVIIGVTIFLLGLTSISWFIMRHNNSEKQNQLKLQNEFVTATGVITQVQKEVYSVQNLLNKSTYKSSDFQKLQGELSKIFSSNYSGQLESVEKQVSNLKSAAKNLHSINEEYFSYVEANAPNFNKYKAKHKDITDKFRKTTGLYEIAAQEYALAQKNSI